MKNAVIAQFVLSCKWSTDVSTSVLDQYICTSSRALKLVHKNYHLQVLEHSDYSVKSSSPCSCEIFYGVLIYVPWYSKCTMFVERKLAL